MLKYRKVHHDGGARLQRLHPRRSRALGTSLALSDEAARVGQASGRMYAFRHLVTGPFDGVDGRYGAKRRDDVRQMLDVLNLDVELNLEKIGGPIGNL